MKKLVSLFLVFTLLAGCVSFASAESGSKIYSRKYPVYAAKAQLKFEREWPLFFTDDADDMPFIDLEELADLTTALKRSVYGEKEFDLTYAREGSVFTLTRENDFWMKVDFDEKTITFNDYNAFLKKEGTETLLDMLYFSGYNDQGQAELFQRDGKASYDRYGDEMVLNMNNYGIPIMQEEDRGYIPLQTASDIVIAPLLNRPLLFNSQAIILASGGDLWDKEKNDYTELGQLYYAPGPVERSQVFADFGYNELCMMLDCHYGLKKKHNFDSFALTFWEIGFDEPLCSQNAADADQAVLSFIDYYLDDLHSGFSVPSWMMGPDVSGLQFGEGPSGRLSDMQENQYKELRAKIMGDSLESYQEVGNTAYVTFDHFETNYKTSHYYEAAKAGERVDDTIGLMVYAHKQINRENSPIENVVVDLSCNTGGDADAALFVIAWILGDAEVSVEDSFTGAQSTMVYRADVNLDRSFDELDTLKGKHVYCLISPVSFSSGNLVPAVCKANQAVTLIGRTSGGGACVVQNMSSAWGTVFSISGNSRLSFRKNGSFYDIDEGVAPDVYISKIETLYERTKLTDLINSMP